ncbi:hypothetical protein [Leptospira santarosai]|nr:hypothetical protein [Leptospira santarosai]AVV79156.1 Uncharacterized protein XB15_01378 [Leptospira santarosai]ONF87044.1 hypothetical protein BWD13_07575 [Leptospira santarosai serovar Grippotyphosa]
MSNSRIESLGISHFNIFILRSKVLKPDTNENDKLPSWDGSIIVYDRPDHNDKKEFILGRIPIQVKSREDFPPNKESYSLEKLDAINYLNNGGIIFIRPIFNDNSVKFFGKILLPLTIKNYLLNSKRKSNTIRIRLKEYSNIENFVNECKFFLENQPLQRNQNNHISIGKVDLTQGTLFTKSLKKENIYKSVLSDDSYLYFKLKDTDITVPVKAKLSEIGFNKEVEIKINEKVYFNKAFLGEKANGFHTIRLNKGLLIEFDSKNIKIHFSWKLDSDFDETLSALRFLRDLEDSNSFVLGTFPFTFDSYKASETILDQVILYEDTYNAFSYLNLNTVGITIQDLESSFQEISEIIYIVNQRMKVKIDDCKKGFYKVYKISTIVLILIFIPMVDSEFAVFNFTDEMDFGEQYLCTSRTTKTRVVCSKYLILDRADLIPIIVNHCDAALRDIDAKYDDKLRLEYSFLLLSCISYFDSSKDIRILSFAERLNQVIIENVEDDSYNTPFVINKYQIIFRTRDFSASEAEEIIKLKEDFKNQIVTCLCVNILLKNIYESDSLYSKLTEEERIEIDSWPIMNLYRSLKT